MPIYKKVNKDFFKKWSTDMAYVLGFFCADGSITINPRGSHYIDIGITDKELLESIKKSLISEHKIKVRKGNINESILYRLQIGSKEMCDDLRKLGLHEQKSFTMKLPNVPKKYLGDFVRGYFDGDGNVWTGFVHKERKKPLSAMQTTFTSCSKEFLEDLYFKLKYLGLSGGSLYGNGNAYRLSYSINDSILLFNLMYDNLQSELFLDRRRIIFEKYITMRW